MTERELLIAGLRELGVAECPSAADNLLRYSEILREKNKVMNLTAITDPTEIVTRHFLDCAALAPYMPQDGRVLDVGTGAGFPGMPLAILCPQTEFVLLDALRKRIDFLNEVIAELGLTNVTAVHARAEDYARDNRGTFDLAVSRAVAACEVILIIDEIIGNAVCLIAEDTAVLVAPAQTDVSVFDVIELFAHTLVDRRIQRAEYTHVMSLGSECLRERTCYIAQSAGFDERSAFAGNIHDFHKAEPPQQRVRKQR